MVYGDSAVVQAYRDLLTLYQQGDPSRAVDLVTVTGADDYVQRLGLEFSGATAPDVMLVNYVDLARFASRGLLEPLGPYLAASDRLAQGDFYPEALAPFRWGRQLVCLPRSASGLVVYYNRDLFRQAGLGDPAGEWSWDDFLTTARALTRDVDGDGRADQYGLGLEPTLVNLAPFIWQGKGKLVDYPAWPRALELQAPAVITATQWVVALQTTYHVVPGVQDEASEASQERFVNGWLGMLVDSRVAVPRLRQQAAFDWDVAPLPENHGRGTNVALADGYCLAAGSAHKAAAWQFIEFAASAEGQAILAASGAVVPSLPAVAESPAFLHPAERPSHGQVFVEALRSSRLLPMLPNWSDIELIADDELRQAFYGQADVLQALTRASKRSDEYFMTHVGP
jgi:multiple sugar transport system substrate-binding protein